MVAKRMDGNGSFEYIYQYKDHLGNIRMSYTDNSVDDYFSFTEGIEGWNNPSTGSVSNTDQKLNLSVQNKYGNTNKYYFIDPSKPLKIEFDFEQGDMVKPTFFVRERINGVWEPSGDRDKITNMSDGHYEMDLTLSSDYIRVYFEKSTASDDGTLTTCYVDNFKIYQRHVEIVEENNYYPFGLQHKGYNSAVSSSGNSTAQKWRFQGQELTEDLGLGTYEFRYRMHDPAIGRFWQIDPIGEEYSYQSPYNFAENRVIDGIELEGLEWKSVKDEETGNTNLTLTIQLQDNSGLNDKQLAKVKENFKQQFSESFSGEGVSGELIIEDAVDSKGDFLVTLTDQKPNPVYDDEGNIVGEKYSGGKTPTDGSTQKNSFEVTAKTDGTKRGYSAMSRSFSHEAGHSAGLLHPWDSGNTVTDIQQGSPTVKNKTIRQNLMNSDQNPSSTNKGTSGKALTNGQLKSIDKLIREQQ